jgi:hypothetical protein
VKIKYPLAVIAAIWFYTKIDILIWQRIFENHSLYEYGIGVYHWGWLQSLLGYMIVGAILFAPNWREVIGYPITLAVLAYSGLEDVLYYWLDGREIPATLPWLDKNPLILHPITNTNLVLSAAFWVFVLIIIHLAVARLHLRALGAFPERFIYRFSKIKWKIKSV